jgi:uncharacterized membrane protein
MAHALTHLDDEVHVQVRKIGVADIKDAIAKGIDDFLDMPTHAVFLSLIYPTVGLLLVQIAIGGALMPLVFPIVAGFALVGPFAALGLYDLSRRREQGLDRSAGHVFFEIFQLSSLGAITLLGLCLMTLFIVWLIVAQMIYQVNFGSAPPDSLSSFAADLVGTPSGWMLIVVGNAAGFLFALTVLTISVVSFPLLLDRPVGLATAVFTSCRVVAANPIPMAAWGLTVAMSLALGSAPLLFGLAVVLPVLGHATWHLYRKVVVAD